MSAPEQASRIDRTDPIVEDTLQALRNLTRIKIRIGLLESLDAELTRRGNQGADIRNELAYQLAVDSFDMLIVDLASLREGLCTGKPESVGSTGLFKKLKARPEIFRTYLPDDFHIPKEDESHPELDLALKRHRAEKANEVFTELFEHMPPIEPIDIDKLRQKFSDSTEPLRKDRSRVRAHRYEGDSPPDPKLRQNIVEAKEQIEIFDQLLNNILLALTRGIYDTSLPTLARPHSTAMDLADIITFGTIDAAVVEYGMTPEAELCRRPSSENGNPFFCREYRVRHLATNQAPFSRDSRRTPSLPQQSEDETET